MKFLVVIALILTSYTLVKSQQRRQDWWENGNFYQIYPRSFVDSDGDGIGDLNGITSRLDYFQGIKMDGVWLSPIFKSPMVDFGYDISDYTDVHPDYGTLDDLVNLISVAHSKGLHVILDFVPNHTSDEHEWFKRSVAGDDEYRDFYIWHDGVVNATTGERKPPSNWISLFRGSAWEWNDQRQQYYLHQFGIKQPDLNYRNPAVLQAMDDVLRFWLDKGIDGFRIDAEPYFFEAEIDPATGTYPDEPVIEDVASCPDPEAACHLQHTHTKDQDGDIEIIYHWRELVDDWKQKHNTDTKVLMTESFSDFDILMKMYGNGKRNGSHIPFNFELLTQLNINSTAADYKYQTENWLDNMPKGVFANWVYGNHDNNRIATRLGPERVDLINIYLQTVPGIAVTYYGEELGMEDVFVSWEDTVDIQACTTNPQTFEKFSRDPERTPFQWDSSTSAGFSASSKTWLPVSSGYKKQNVAVELKAKHSHLRSFIKLTTLRKTELAFDDGKFEAKLVDNILLYTRKSDYGDSFLIVLNFSNKKVKLNLADSFPEVSHRVKVEVSSIHAHQKEGIYYLSSSFIVSPNAGYVLRIPQPDLDWDKQFKNFYNQLF